MTLLHMRSFVKLNALHLLHCCNYNIQLSFLHYWRFSPKHTSGPFPLLCFKWCAACLINCSPCWYPLVSPTPFVSLKDSHKLGYRIFILKSTCSNIFLISPEFSLRVCLVGVSWYSEFAFVNWKERSFKFWWKFLIPCKLVVAVEPIMHMRIQNSHQNSNFLPLFNY